MTFHTQLDASKYCCVVLLLPWFFETNKFVLLYNTPISVVKIVHVLSLVFTSLILAPEKELEPDKGGEVTCDNRGLGVGKAHLPLTNFQSRSRRTKICQLLLIPATESASKCALAHLHKRLHIPLLIRLVQIDTLPGFQLVTTLNFKLFPPLSTRADPAANKLLTMFSRSVDHHHHISPLLVSQGLPSE